MPRLLNDEMVLAGKYVREALKRYESTAVEPVYPELWAYEGMYHQAVGDLPFGAPAMVQARKDYTGRAVNYGGKATDIPLANYGVTMDEYGALVGVLSAEWTWDELRKEQLSRSNQYLTNVDVVTNYRTALDRGLREWMHYKNVFGDPSITAPSGQPFAGLLTNPYVEVIEVAVADNAVTAAGASANDAYDWFRRETSAFRKATRLTANATSVLTSENVGSALDIRFDDGTSDGTAGDLLLGQTGAGGRSRKLSSINVVNELSGDMVIDPDVGNLTTIGGVTIAATDDLLLMTDANVAGNITKHYADIQAMPVYTPDGGLTYKVVGMAATSEMIYSAPLKARLYVLKTA